MNYRDNPAVNFSTLKFMSGCPLAYKHALEQKVKPTPAMLKGSAFHCAVLQPDVFPRDWARKSDKRAGEQATRIADGDYDDVLRMRDKYYQCSEMVNGVVAGAPERAIYWRDEYTGIDCKARIDLIVSAGGFWELKTVAPSYANPDKFGRHCVRMQYDVQLAFYHDGLQYLGMVADPVTLIAVEQKPPYDVIIYDVPHYVIEDGRAVYLKYLSKVAECKKSGTWPGRSGNGRLKLVLPQRFDSDNDDDNWE